MIEDLLSMPLHLRHRLAAALDSGLLPLPASEQAIGSVLGSSEYVPAGMGVLGYLGDLQVPATSAAAWIRSSLAQESSRTQVDIVWSGPEVAGVHARDTRRVFEELIESSKRSICLSTYVYFDGPKAFEVLARELDAKPDLRVTLLLNIQRRRGDTTSSEELVRQFTDRFWRSEWPGANRPDVFYDPRSLDIQAAGSALHAKAIVSDDEVVLVTSANLTEAAFDRNIELGLLVRDRFLAANVSAHFQALVDTARLVPLPAS